MVRRISWLIQALCVPRNLLAVPVVALAAAGLTTYASEAGFTWEWYGAIILLLAMAWGLTASLLASDPASASLHLRQLAFFLSPLALFTLRLTDGMALLPAQLPILFSHLAWGGMVTIFLAQWVLPNVPRLPPWLRAQVDSLWAPWALAATWAALYGYLTIFQWWNFSQFSQDMAMYEQALHNTWQGRFMQYSCDLRFPGLAFSRFGDHFEPIMLLFLPLYRLWATPVWLMLAQVCAVAVGAPAAATITRRYTGSSAAGTLVAGMYLLHPGLLQTMRYDFHPSTMAIGLLLWGLALTLANRPLPGFLMFVAAMACKENIPATVAMIGLFFAWRGTDREQKRYGFALAGFSLLWGFLAIKFIIPACSPTGEWFYNHGLQDPQDFLGGAPRMASVYFASRMSYLLSMLTPLAGLPLLGPAGLLVAAPELVVNVLGESNWMHSLLGYYHTTALAGLVLGAALGLRAINGWLGHALPDQRRRQAWWRGILLGLAITAALAFRMQLPLLTTFPYHTSALTPSERAQLAGLLRQIPDDVPVLVNDGGLASHLPRRQLLHFCLSPNVLPPELLESCDNMAYLALSTPGHGWDEASFTRHYHLKLLGAVQRYHVWEVER